MALETDFDDLMWDTVTVNVFSTQAAYGLPSVASTGVIYQAYVAGTQKLVRGADGQTIMSALTVYIGKSSTGGDPPALTVRDQLTLSDATTPRLIAVDSMADDHASTTPYCMVAYCG